MKKLIDHVLLERMARSIARHAPEFDSRRFRSLARGLGPLELKDRVREGLRRELPLPYDRALAILLASAADGTLEGFDLWPYTDFVQTYGLDDPERSLDALRELTPRFTAEFGVRPFLLRHPRLTLRYLERCTRDPDPHVRRWASEGSRPRLPWGERLAPFVRDPRPTLRILERLRRDPDEYVRRSVANHLNDIAKDHPELAIETLERWRRGRAGDDAALDWIVRRALRTLIKRGDPRALALIGVSAKPEVRIDRPRLAEADCATGGCLEFSVRLRSLADSPQKLVVDYAIDFLGARGRHSAKVFKLRTFVLGAGEEVILAKRHSLREITTRRYYPGIHRLTVQVNGRPCPAVEWRLVGVRPG